MQNYIILSIWVPTSLFINHKTPLRFPPTFSYLFSVFKKRPTCTVWFQIKNISSLIRFLAAFTWINVFSRLVSTKTRETFNDCRFWKSIVYLVMSYYLKMFPSTLWEKQGEGTGWRKRKEGRRKEWREEEEEAQESRKGEGEGEGGKWGEERER